MPLIDPRPMKQHVWLAAYCASLGGQRASKGGVRDPEFIRDIANRDGIEAVLAYEEEFGQLKQELPPEGGEA